MPRLRRQLLLALLTAALLLYYLTGETTLSIKVHDESEAESEAEAESTSGEVNNSTQSSKVIPAFGVVSQFDGGTSRCSSTADGSTNCYIPAEGVVRFRKKDKDEKQDTEETENEEDTEMKDKTEDKGYKAEAEEVEENGPSKKTKDTSESKDDPELSAEEIEAARFHKLLPLYDTLRTSKVPGRVKKKKKGKKLEYPEGFQKYDTSRPDSPYKDGLSSPPRERLNSIPGGARPGSTVLERLRAWCPYSQVFNVQSTNPVIWQTFKQEPGRKAVPYNSWLTVNKPRYSRQFVDDEETDTLISGLSRDLHFLNVTYHALPTRIMQLDFLRYLELYRNGGVYADIDSECFEPVEKWYSTCYPDSPSRPRDRVKQPGLLVGIEFDLTNDPKIRSIDGQVLGIGNYVFAANKGHPVLAKILASIVDRVNKTIIYPTRTPPEFVSTINPGTRTEEERLDAEREVSEWTGRSLWTNTIIEHIQESTRHFSAESLHGLQAAKIIDDICILPIAAFGAGQFGLKNSPEASIEGGSLMKHFFMRSWSS